MPNVLPPFKGWRIVIFTNDHRPPHVHVIGPEESARFELLCDLGKEKLMDSIGFKLAQLQQIEVYLLSHIERLCSEWERIHGH
jgi:Domain of unknown function (DUF4160)